ncbi:MAG: chorismate mutase [Flavobacteriales bacterium]
MPNNAPLNTRSFDQWGLGFTRPLVIAGPCSAESRDQVLATARGIVKHAPQVKAFRAGVWKPRTQPGHFEGAGNAALDWLKAVREETGLLTIVEVATAEHVDACLKAGIDMLWIGARTTPNPFSVQEIADALRGVDVPVFVKNPINPDLHLWIGTLERLGGAGLTRLAAIHRGFNWFERTTYRNSPMWEFPIRLKARFPDLELVCDPSHISGTTELISPLAQQALDLNFSGLMIEAHHDPVHALSDARQQLTPQRLGEVLRELIVREQHPAQRSDRLQELRDLVDQLDEEIAQKMGSRMDIAERIGEWKADHNVAILQPERWDRIMHRQLRLAKDLGLSRAFVEELMNAIHKESIRRQTEVLVAANPTSVGSPAASGKVAGG